MDKDHSTPGNRPPRKPAKLHFRYSSVNAGKSTQLLQIAYNYAEMGKRTMLFTAAVDDRTAVGQIASRLGAQREAMTFDSQTNFCDVVGDQSDIDCLLVDESQFLTIKQVKQLHRIAAVGGVPVMCFGLRTDFQGETFTGSTYLLALAEDIQEIRAICSCGRKSTMNMRLGEAGQRLTTGPQILIGGNERYRQLCARCFYTD